MTAHSPRRVVQSLFVLVPLLAASLAVGVQPASAAVADLPLTTWQTNGRVATILRVGDIVYVGGLFTQVQPDKLHPGLGIPRNNAAAFYADPNGPNFGEPTPWNPNTLGEVDSLAASADGNTIYVGGDFTKLGGVQHTKIGAVNATNGSTVPTFNAGANAIVRAMGLINDNLYVAGSFTKVSNFGLTGTDLSDRGALAALDAVSNQSSDGNVLGWDPGPTSCSSTGCGSGVRAMTIPSKNQIVVGGGFESIKGRSQPSIASIDPTSGNLQSWASHPSTPVLALDNDGRYVYGVNKTNQAIRYRSIDGTDTWHAQADGDIQAVALFDGVLYIGGHFQNVDGNAEPHAAALIAANGQRLDWGGGADSTAGIFAMEAGGGLFIGGDFKKVGDPNTGQVDQQYYAQFAEVVPNITGYLFEEHFTQGNFNQWDKVGKNLLIDPLSFDAAQPGVTGQGGLAYASGFFQVSSLTACAQASVSVTDPGANGVSLVTLRTYSGTKVAHVYVTQNRAIEFSDDVAPSQVYQTGVQLPIGWSKVEICGTKGTHGDLEVYLDGTRIDQNAASDVNLGVDSFAQVEIGDRAKNQTFAFSIDDVIVDTQPI